MLDQIDYMLKLAGKKSSFGYAGHVVSKIKEPLSQIEADLDKVRGFDKQAVEVIREILSRRTAAMYESLIRGQIQ